jgi:hypothetical protein
VPRRLLERVEHEEARPGQAVLGERLLQLALEVRRDADRVVRDAAGIGCRHCHLSKCLSRNG